MTEPANSAGAAAFTTPILFVIFNRPDLTARIFAEIRKTRPTRLFVTGDGPRAHKPNEAELCQKTRDAVIKNIDWPCEVKTLFREKNLGCKYAVAGGIDWFFENVEEGIILEDDDVPEPTFFTFCAELLEKYRHDPRVMHISGLNVQLHNKDFSCDNSYYFLSIPSVWGWATWRRAWKHYDVEVSSWPQMRAQRLLCRVLEDAVAFRFGQKFQGYFERKMTSYDGQWMFACLKEGGLSIYPSKNLISNIGFTPDAAHPTASDPLWDSQPTQAMPLPLSHPAEVKVNPEWERYNFAASYGINRYRSQRIKWWFKSHLTGPYFFFKKAYHALRGKKYDATEERALMC